MDGEAATQRKFSLPKLTLWDFAAIGIMVFGVVLMAANWHFAGSDGPIMLFAPLQLAVCLGSLMVLGKTAHEGTLWGNLAAVGGMFVGMGGVLLAAALWAAA